MNGYRQGDAVLEPAYTDVSKVIPYQVFDVTALLCKPAKMSWHRSSGQAGTLKPFFRLN